MLENTYQLGESFSTMDYVNKVKLLNFLCR